MTVPETPAFVARDLRRIDNGAVYGTVTLWLPHWKVYFHEVVWGHNADGREWVRLPSRQWTGREGETRYTRLIGWADAATERRFQEAALASIHRLVDELGRIR